MYGDSSSQQVGMKSVEVLCRSFETIKRQYAASANDQMFAVELGGYITDGYATVRVSPFSTAPVHRCIPQYSQAKARQDKSALSFH